jgi:flagellar hook assembly protein FlgD
LSAITTLGSLTLTVVKCRIFTPNGDGRNDKARFEFDNPEQLPIAGTIYDLSGARVGSLQQGNSIGPTDVMLWDGKNTDGQVVAGGIYIYQIEFQGKHATGTVIVAR